MSIKRIGKVGNSSLIGLVGLRTVQIKEYKVTSFEFDLAVYIFRDRRRYVSCTILVNQIPQSISDKVEKEIKEAFKETEELCNKDIIRLEIRDTVVKKYFRTILQGFLKENFIPTSNRLLWIYDGWLWKMSEEYEPEEARLLILEEIDKERRKFERLKKKFDVANSDKTTTSGRERIPSDVRIEVWRRDEGKCVRCGGRENLEYDHIIPISKGGSNTARNIELLCEKCNRAKSEKIE